jgi:hypothetical protein
MLEKPEVVDGGNRSTCVERPRGGAETAAKGISHQRQLPRGALGQTNAFDLTKLPCN